MLHVATSGKKNQPTLLFLHGFMGASADWQEIASPFADDYFVLAPDLPGHGQSHFNEPSRFKIEAAASAVIDLLDTHGIVDCVLVGYSMGGRLALYIAAHYPERVRRLVLESASPGLADADARAARMRWDESVAVKLESMPFSAFLDEWYQMGLFESFRAHPGFEQAVARRMSNEPTQLALSMRMMGTGSQPSLWDDWVALMVPTLMIVGELDVKYVGISAEMHTLNPSAQVAILPGVGHNTHFENTDAFIAAIGEFVG